MRKTGSFDFRTAYGSCERRKWFVGETSPIPTGQALTDYHLSRSIPPIEYSTHAQTGLLCAHFVLMIAALESTQFVQFALPLSDPPFYNRNAPWPSKLSHSIRSLNASGGQKYADLQSLFPV
jgi:hypothetical protein